MSGPLLTIDNVSKVFATAHGPVHALESVNLQVDTGECLGIVGESGSGKSTLANLILGILAPSQGTIAYRGTPLPARRQPQRGADAALGVQRR